ncbi:hypothetical protein P3T23_003249 [Paraburkholderia sp. GAS448]
MFTGSERHSIETIEDDEGNCRHDSPLIIYVLKTYFIRPLSHRHMTYKYGEEETRAMSRGCRMRPARHDFATFVSIQFNISFHQEYIFIFFSSSTRRQLFGALSACAFCLVLLTAPGFAPSTFAADNPAVSTTTEPLIGPAKVAIAQRVGVDESIRPFRVHVPQAQLDDLRRRIAATRWPDKETVNDDWQGIQVSRVQELVRYWDTQYDWRKAEAQLNALPQFVTTIDGVDIQFIHVRCTIPMPCPSF